MKKISEHQNKGFGLIEMLVSVAIFAIVAVMALTAILSIIDAGEKSQSLNSVMQNLNIALETMAREIRTGMDYSCTENNSPTNGQDCSNPSSVIQFQPADATSGSHTIYKLVGTQLQEEKAGTTGFVPVTADEVKIDTLAFHVYNAAPNTAGQPRVLMTITGHVQTRQKNNVTFTLQTTMTQRILSQQNEQEI